MCAYKVYISILSLTCGLALIQKHWLFCYGRKVSAIFKTHWEILSICWDPICLVYELSHVKKNPFFNIVLPF